MHNQVPASNEWMNTDNTASWQRSDLATMFMLTRPLCCVSHQLPNTISTLKQHKWHSQLLQFRQLIEYIVRNEAKLGVIQVPASDEWMNMHSTASWQPI
jgi:hypothetical protein